MNTWNSLVKHALLGTGNGFKPPAAPDTLQAALTSISNDDQDMALLSTAALIGVAYLAGRIPDKLNEFGEASPLETQQYISDEASVFLKRILDGEYQDVLPEFLSIVSALGYIVPPETLPALLGLGRNKLRRSVLPVIGERGRWLARYNPSWTYALGREDESDVWENGTRSERIDLLERLRGYDPEQALELIKSTWEVDPYEERAAFVTTLSIGLSLKDEPFLETCLDNSRKEVRDAALDLLIRLPESRHSARMTARLLPLLEYKSSILKGATIHVTLPEQVDAGAKRDGVTGLSISKRMGKQANQLAQMISLTPPSFWTQKWKQTPEKILQAALKSEWKEALISGWYLGAVRSQDRGWAAAIAEMMVKQSVVPAITVEMDFKDLALLIPVETFEELAKNSVINTIKDLNDNHPILGLLEAYDIPWSEALSRTILSSIQRQAANHHWRLMRALPAFALRVPVSLTETYIKGWPNDSKSWEPWIDQFCAVLRFRRDMTATLRR